VLPRKTHVGQKVFFGVFEESCHLRSNVGKLGDDAGGDLSGGVAI
jgi:hypothetical protein